MINELDGSFVKELSKLILKDFSKETFLGSFGKVYNGIAENDKVGLFQTANGFTKVVASSCNPDWQDADVVAETDWSLGNFMLPVAWCYDSLNVELRRLQSLYDLDENEAFQKYASEYLETALAQSIVAKAFFGSTNTADYTTITGLGGVNGLLTQMDNYVTNGDADASQKVSFTNTKAALRTGTGAIDLLEDLIDSCPEKSEDSVIVINQALYDDLAYVARVNKGVYFETQWSALFGGLKETTYNGYRVVIVPTLDKVLKQMGSGDKFANKRAIAIMGDRQNFMFGSITKEDAGIGTIDIWFEKNEQKEKGIVKYSLGVAIPDPKGFSYAY